MTAFQYGHMVTLTNLINMKTFLKPTVLRGMLHIIILLLFSQWKAASQILVSWGGDTNGLRLGVGKMNVWHTNQQYDVQCEISIQNVSTNNMIFIKSAPLESRYAIMLYDPQGNTVSLLPDSLASINHLFVHGGTVATNGSDLLDYFFVSDVFDLKTNGLHTLVFSEYITTNQFLHNPSSHSNYFQMPPITTSVDISPNEIKQGKGR